MGNYVLEGKILSCGITIRDQECDEEGPEMVRDAGVGDSSERVGVSEIMGTLTALFSEPVLVAIVGIVVFSANKRSTTCKSVSTINRKPDNTHLR